MRSFLIKQSGSRTTVYYKFLPYTIKFIFSKMKWILSFIFPAIIIISFYSCGLEDTNGVNKQKMATVSKVYIMDIDGTNLKFLAYGNKPQFSPDGSKIYFGNLNIINIDGSGLKQLVPQSVISQYQSVWDYTISNDGKKIVFSTFDALYIMNLDGSGLLKLIAASGSNFYANESFSPTDSVIVFEDDFSVGSINSDGTNNKTLVSSDSAHQCYNPVYTSNGKDVLFINRDYYNDYSILDYILKTGEIGLVFSGQPTNGMEVTHYGFVIFSANNNIQKFDLATYKDVILTEGYEETFSKEWNKIIYLKPNDAQRAIYIYDLSTGTISTINTGLTWGGLNSPKLSPDGNHILFQVDSTYLTSVFN